MKKILAMLIVVLLLVSLAACTGQTAPSNETDKSGTDTTGSNTGGNDGDVVEIVWAMQGAANETEGWNAVVNAANKQLEKDNIKIVVQNIPTSDWDEYYQKITAQIIAGDCPDIGRIAESLMPIAIEKNQVLELTDRINADIDRTQYFDTVFNNAGAKDGKIYGLPSGVYQKLVYFNKDLFDAANVEYPSSDWDHPTTLAEYTEMAKKLSSGEGANRNYGFYAETDIFMVGCFAGENIYNADNTYQITDAHRQVYSYLDQMLNVDKSLPTPVDTQIMGGFDMFCAGKLAMVCDGTWWQQSARSITDFNVGIAAAPSLDGKANAVSFIDNYVIWKDSKHPEEAWKALQAIFSETCANELAKTGTGGVPVNRNTLANYSATLIGDNFDEASQASFMQSMDHTWAMPYNSNFNEVSSQTNAVLQPWMVGNKSLDDALTGLESILADLTK